MQEKYQLRNPIYKYRVSQVKVDETKQLFQTENMEKILITW